MNLKPIITPPRLKASDTIGIFAPSSIIDEDRFNQGVEILKARGFKIKIHSQCYLKNKSSAGMPVDKANALHDLIRDDEVNVILAAAGGNHAVHFLDLIDYDLLRAQPKLIGGFSDVTALLSALYAKAGMTSWHAPTVQSLCRIDEASLSSMFSVSNDVILRGVDPIHTGQANGVLWGGNLAMLCALQGSDYLPNAKNSILFIEDIGEELSRIDRMLWQVRTALPFESLAGIIFGEFTNLQDTGRPFGFTLDDIIGSHTRNLSIPIVKNAPVGHASRNIALYFGRPIQFIVDGKSAQIHYT